MDSWSRPPRKATTRAPTDLRVDVDTPLDWEISRRRGELASGDETLDSGEYYDRHTFEVAKGEELYVDVRSAGFDPWLGVLSPSGEKFTNEDCEEGATHHACQAVRVGEAGTWTVIVTSDTSGESGAYDLRVRRVVPGDADEPSTTEGRLAAGDSQLDSGEYYDGFEWTGHAGEHVRLQMVGDGLDPYVAIVGPDGFKAEDDDGMGRGHAQLDAILPVDGTYQLLATTYEPGETGRYELRAQSLGTVEAPQGGEGGTPGGAVSTRGTLAAGDSTLNGGEFYDTHPFQVAGGGQIVLDLRSSEFDPWLGLISPSGERFHNADHEGNGRRSLLTVPEAEAGQWTAIVTSETAGESGPWTLRIHQGGAQTQAASGPRVLTGQLDSGDATLNTGEYLEIHEVDAVPGQRMRVELSATGFDPYLLVVGPHDFKAEDDDGLEDEQGGAALDLTFPEAGTYKVVVTSYEPGDTGDYRLVLSHVASVEAQREETPATGPDPVAPPSRPAAVADARELSEALTRDDDQLGGGEYADFHTFEGRAGQYVELTMESDEVDSYLGLLMPNGDATENDDWPGLNRTARIAMQLPVNGRYRVLATTLNSGETGAYKLNIRFSDEPPEDPQAKANGRIHGVFVGISTWPEARRLTPLGETAGDAQRLHAAFQAGIPAANRGELVLLTDAQATKAAVEQAFARIGASASADDTFVFFYSGHGGRVKRDDWQPTDPDGKDETLSLYDEELLDDEMKALYDQLDVSVAMILLDSCFSGGFAKDVISAPGRMGMFSSEEDVTSSTAAKFRAGGFLAAFLVDAVGGRLADDGDNLLTAIELSEYVHSRYRVDVKSGKAAASGGADYVRTSHNLGYQKLVVDRGSITPYQVLFRWAAD